MHHRARKADLHVGERQHAAREQHKSQRGEETKQKRKESKTPSYLKLHGVFLLFRVDGYHALPRENGR